MISPRWRPSLQALLAVGLALMLLAAAAAQIVKLNDQADRHRVAEVQLAQVGRLTDTVRLAVSGLVNGQLPDRGVLAEHAASRRRLVATAHDLARRSRLGVPVLAAVSRLNAALAEQLDLVATQRLPAAVAMENDRVVPAYSQLEELIGSSDVILATEAAAAGKVADRDVMLIVIGTALLLLFGFVVFESSRRRRLRGAAERRALGESEAKFHLLFESNPHPMWVYDLDTLAFLEVNGAAIEHYGFGRDEFLAMGIDNIRPAEDLMRLRQSVDAPRTATTQSGTWRHCTKSGVVIDVEVTSQSVDFAGTAAALVMAQDVTERLRAERALVHQAMHDPLTGLPNRSLLIDRLDQSIARCARDGSRAGVIFVDLDRFKVINDGKGHSAGDRLLIQVAARIRGAVRPGDTVSRFGGDEFAIVVDGVADQAEAIVVSSRIGWALDAPFFVDDTELFISASQGIALAKQGETAEAVLSRADAGMYFAKERGGARSEYADESLRSRSSHRLELESALRRAIDHREFVLHYQPVVSVADGAIVGAEALVRWNHPEQGLLYPDKFIAAAEQSGLIVPIGEWVLNQALQDAAGWRTSNPGAEAPSIAVNLSAAQLMVPNLPFVVARAISGAGIEASRLHLEVTESVLMQDVERAVQVLLALRALGVHIDVDDFGTGYSSLTYIQQLPVDTLKIDKSFVDRLDGPNADGSIVTAIVRLGESLGVEVVAEGVESGHQQARLAQLGCQFAQGYHFARPVPLAGFTELLSGGLLPELASTAT